ncbi:hypothetical protein ACEPAI_8363 [Sanghuangporus weigelae]
MSQSRSPRRKKKSISATTLAVHHHLQCDLFLYNSYHGPVASNSFGSKSNPRLRKRTEPPELLKATFSRGNRWEETLFSWLDRKNLLLRVLSNVLSGREIEEIIELALDERDHFYVAGLSFEPPVGAFESRYHRESGKRSVVEFGIAKPDLVEIRRDNDGIWWRVIDAKSSADVKTSHHVQIYFYHICLESLFPSHYHPMGTAAVWIPTSIYGGGNTSSSASEPSFDNLRSIATPLLSSPLDDYLFNKVPYILDRQKEEVKWHLNPLCRGCTYERDCTERAVRDGELGVMPNVSIQDAEVLRSFLAISGKQKTSLSSSSSSSSSSSAGLSDMEDLYKTVKSKSEMLEMQKNHASIYKKVKRILKFQGHMSPVVEAARTKQVQVLKKRIFALPREEDIAIIISLVLDPATNEIAAYCISTYSNLDASITPGSLSGTRETLINDLASILQYILDLSEVRNVPPRSQCYVFNAAERAALQRTLVEAALTSDKLDDDVQDAVRTCIGAVCEGAALLSTTFQPLVLSGALMNFLSRKSGVSTADLKLCLRRLGLPSRKGTDEELRKRIRDELERLKDGGKRIRGSGIDSAETPESEQAKSQRGEIGALPRVVVVKNAIEQLLALPIPGYWDLSGCHTLLRTSSLECPTDDAIYSAFIGNCREDLDKMMNDRNLCIYEVLCEARKRATGGRAEKTDILVNEARVLASEFMDLCSQDHLRKLFFMQQFEVLARLTALWQDRLEGCLEAPRLEYKYSNRLQDNTCLHYFALSSGYVDFSSDKEKSFFGYLLTEDVDSDLELPVEPLFDDLAVVNLIFPLNKYQRVKWNQQPPAVQERLFVADVQDIVVRNFKTFIVLRTFGDFNLRLKPKTRYRLSPRLVDFNITKILSTLLELDLHTPANPGYMLKPPFLQLFSDAKAFAKFSSESDPTAERYWAREVQIQRTFRELSGLGKEAAGSLMLKPSQEHALRRILKYRLSVIWGPPGTGKTYTISLSLLRLIQIKSADDNPRRLIIFVTAMTHAAIDACASKLNGLMLNYQSLPGLDTGWMRNVSLERVMSGATHPVPDSEKTYIYAGTVYQLYSYCKRIKLKADCIVIDEAGQLGLGPASLVLKSLENVGRVIVAGDSEQLAPILTTQYPQVESRLFGSILDCLMANTGDEELSKANSEPEITTSLSYHDHGTVSTIVQLTENFRLNPDLGDFVSTIYKRSFKPQKSQNVKVAKQLETLANIEVDEQDTTYARARDILVALSSAMRRRSQNILQEPKRTSKRQRPQDVYSDSDTTIPALDIRPISLALIRLSASSEFPDQMGYEIHVRAEATFAAALVHLIQEAAGPDETIFVATPHRVQRQAVKDALLSRVDNLSEAFGALQIQDNKPVFVRDKITVDTIERLQGSEAAFVICLFSHTYSGNASTAIDFLLERRRLNVAISRAKTLCILVTSKEVLRPSVRIFSNPQSAKGFAFLKAFEDRAWSGDATVNLDELAEAAGLKQG